MKCEQCGFDNKDGLKFCVQCGTQLKTAPEETEDNQTIDTKEPDSDVQTSNQSKSKKKVLAFVIIGAIVLCAVLLMVILIASRSDKTGYVPYYPGRAAFFSTTDGSLVVYDGRIIETADQVDDVLHSEDDSIVYYVDDDVLYCINEGKVTKCATDVKSILSGYDYLCDRYMYYMDSGSTMWQYDRKKDKKTMVFEADDDSAEYIIAVSHDGETVAYAVYWENRDDIELESYVWKNGKKTRMEVDHFVAGNISDDGKCMYGFYMKDIDDICLCAVKNGEKIKLTSDVNSTYFETNIYRNQLMFTSGGNTYVSMDYGEKQKICSDETAYICGFDVEDFNSIFCRTVWDSGTYSLYYLNNHLEMQSVAKRVASYLVSLDGTTIVYKKENGGLYKVTSAKPDEEEKIASEVNTFVISSNGKTVYYTDKDNTLYISNGGERERLLDEVYSLHITPDDDVYVIIEYDQNSMGGELYHITGSKYEKVTGASNVKSVTVVGDSVYYKSNGSRNKDDTVIYDLYVKNTNDKKFKLLSDGVQ